MIETNDYLPPYFVYRHVSISLIVMQISERLHLLTDILLCFYQPWITVLYFYSS